MNLPSTGVCAAIGCGKKAAGGKAFCARDLKRLPEVLRDPAEKTKATIHLGRADGYLVDWRPKTNITHAPASSGREYV